MMVFCTNSEMVHDVDVLDHVVFILLLAVVFVINATMLPWIYMSWLIHFLHMECGYFDIMAVTELFILWSFYYLF